MKIRWQRFNLYLMVALVVIAAGGCQSSSAEKKSKKLRAMIRLHGEGSRDGTKTTEVVPVYRQNPVMVTVEKVPVLDAGHVAKAEVIEVMGDFALRIQFDARGTTLLEEFSSRNRPRRIAIFCQFGEDFKQYRWLAAPMVTRHISDGVLTFTPDATREEAEQIAQGLNNVVKMVKTWIER